MTEIISILLPTRERPQQLKRFLESLDRNTSDKQNLEIILYIDEDDFSYESQESWRGIEVQPLDGDIIRRFRLSEDRGVIVVRVEPNSQADVAGIVVGDVILAINRESIDSISDYNRVTAKIKGDTLMKTSRGYFVIKEKREH